MDSFTEHFQINEDGSSVVLRRIEIHQLDLRYAHTRVITPDSICSLAKSIDQFGQITPLVIVSHESLVLIDGYRRVAALKHNRKDSAMAELWPCTEQQAILRLLVRFGQRRWEAFEQAGLLRELLNGSKLSHARLANLLGKDPSWVARRLDLLDIDEQWIKLIRSGQLSSWATSRVLIPLARANRAHALSLAGWIAKEGISTRELVAWFGHYQKSNNSTREKMVDEPTLFLKAARLRAEQREARTLREGPEGKWLHDIGMVLKTLGRLQKECGVLRGVDLTLIRQTLDQIKALLSFLDGQIERIHHDKPGNQRSDPDFAKETNSHPRYQQDSQDIEKHRKGGT